MVILTVQLSLELLRGTLIVLVVITLSEIGVAILIHLTTSRGRNGVVRGVYLPGRNEWSNLLLLNLIIMPKKNMCMVDKTSWGSSQVARDSKRMMQKKNPTADVYTKKEVSGMKKMPNMTAMRKQWMK